MPVATPFNSRSLIACVSKVDMTVATNSADWVAPLINPLTIEQLYSLYFNLSGILGTAIANGNAFQENIDINADHLPHKRVCASVYGGSSTEEDEFGLDETFLSVDVTSNIIAMYDGVTTDEGNFLGYSMGLHIPPGSIYAQEVAYFQSLDFATYASTAIFAGWCPAIADTEAWYDWSGAYYDVLEPLTAVNVTYEGIPFIKVTMGIQYPTPIDFNTSITGVELYTY